jgi:hypothetical protein
VDFDNGGEWLNWHLVRYWQERLQPVKLTRSRPYHKDDNAHVEQKNWMWPRQLLGYQRLDNPDTVPRINDLYRDVWRPLHNFFLPSMKLVAKQREGSRIIRRHDEPQTAYQRLRASGELSAKTRRQLREQFESLDPFALAKAVDLRLKRIRNCRWGLIGTAGQAKEKPPKTNEPGERGLGVTHPCSSGSK